jgi:hypothetical protein
MRTGTSEVRQWLALTNRVLNHQVQALPGSLYQSASPQCLGQTAITRVLLIQDVLGRYANGNPPGLTISRRRGYWRMKTEPLR